MSNIDELYGINMPRAGYALSGGDYASPPAEDSILPAGPPMVISANTPGTFGAEWIETYGSSHDAFLSIIDGGKIEAAIDGVSLGSAYNALPNTASDNLWSFVLGTQQIQYVVSGSDIDDARTRVDSFGAIADVRGLCMRLPMMGFGYGKTREMLPIDGSSDGQNSEETKLDRSAWEFGTIEHRWDNVRKTWVTFNDLIVDKENVGLGTAVHSTNADASEGFPYLKGRLEDVWWVRQDETLDGNDGKSDGATTAKVMTHLEHHWFDASEDGSAKLSSIFIIPHNSLDPEGTADVPHERGGENVLGGETTGTGASIDLKSSVHFYKEKAMDGPIKMERKISDIAEVVCCDNGASDLFIGEMIFLDQQPGLCDDEVPPTDVPNEWVPAIRIDECNLMGGHIGELVENDIAAIKSSTKLCSDLHAWSEELKEEIKSIVKDLLAGIGSAGAGAGVVAKQTQKAFADLIAQIEKAFEFIATTSNNDLTNLVAQINTALLECCESSIQFEPTSGGYPSNFDSPKIKAPPVIANAGGVTEFKCDKCGKVTIKAPCSTSLQESFQIGVECGGGTSTRTSEPDYADVGNCQTEET